MLEALFGLLELFGRTPLREIVASERRLFDSSSIRNTEYQPQVTLDDSDLLVVTDGITIQLEVSATMYFMMAVTRRAQCRNQFYRS